MQSHVMENAKMHILHRKIENKCLT